MWNVVLRFGKKSIAQAWDGGGGVACRAAWEDIQLKTNSVFGQPQVFGHPSPKVWLGLLNVKPILGFGSVLGACWNCTLCSLWYSHQLTIGGTTFLSGCHQLGVSLSRWEAVQKVIRETYHIMKTDGTVLSLEKRWPYFQIFEKLFCTR